jgi:hypothetical protein
MRKYGVQGIDEIVNSDPLPNDKDLSPQEIREKDRWYKNRVKAALVKYGLPGGQIDEILNDTGDTMLIDGVQTTYTRMARKWLSVKTLERYNVPFVIDKVSINLLMSLKPVFICFNRAIALQSSSNAGCRNTNRNFSGTTRAACAVCVTTTNVKSTDPKLGDPRRHHQLDEQHNT